MKLSAQWELKGGGLHFRLLPGRTHDQSGGERALAPGSLRIADLGYFNLEQFARMGAGGVFWLSRLKAGTKLFVDGEPVEPNVWLKARVPRTGDRIDVAVEVGARRLPCRLVAVRVPPEVIAQRKARLADEARKKRQPASEAQRALAKWTVYLTNVPGERLSVGEALVLGRLRWQIELLFKLWKSEGRLEVCRSRKPYRILCEVYAKLLGLLISHWIALVSGWDQPRRSGVKTFRAIRRHAAGWAGRWDDPERVAEEMERLGSVLREIGKVQKRRSRPAAFQLLLDPALLAQA